MPNELENSPHRYDFNDIDLFDSPRAVRGCTNPEDGINYTSWATSAERAQFFNRNRLLKKYRSEYPSPGRAVLALHSSSRSRNDTKMRNGVLVTLTGPSYVASAQVFSTNNDAISSAGESEVR